MPKTEKEVITLLASGACIRIGDQGDYLVIDHGEIYREQSSRLADDGWLSRFANGGGYRLSDAGLKQYLKSTDELGSGELISPRAAEKG